MIQFRELFIFPAQNPAEAAVLSRYQSLLGLLLGAFGFGGFLLLYLRGAIRIGVLDKFISFEEYAPSNYPRNAEIKELHRRLASLSNEFDQLKIVRSGAGSGTTTTELAEALLPAVESHLGSILEAKYADEAVGARTATDIATQFDAAIARLVFELGAQTRRSNLNLVIGVLTTLIAVGLLVYMVFGVAPDLSTWPHIAGHYIPRVTIVVFIEVFSFFFLRLYKSTLEELRSYHDDLTKLTLQRVAVESSWLSKEASAKTALAKDLLSAAKAAKVERSAETNKADQYKIIEAVLKTLAKEFAASAKKSEKDDKENED
jgi:hypothetical protein